MQQSKAIRVVAGLLRLPHPAPAVLADHPKRVGHPKAVDPSLRLWQTVNAARALALLALATKQAR